jgi:clostripain
MSKQLAIAVALVSILVASETLVGADRHTGNRAQEKDTKRPWTILVYGAADNNADGPILRFLDSVCKALDDDPGVDLLLLIDRSEGYSRDARFLGEDFTGARLFRLRKDKAERLSGGKHFPEITLEKDTELDSADAANIARFVAWGKATSPAKHYALLIYSHADGKTMCPDEHSGRDMGFAELTDDAGAEAGVDFLALELCNMGGIEIGYQWRPDNGRFGAEVLLAIPNAGPPLDWDRAFARIRSRGHAARGSEPAVDPSTMTAADFGKLVIEEGHRGRQGGGRHGPGPSRESAGCYDLRRSGKVKEAVDEMSRALANSESKSVLLELGGSAFHYAGGGHCPDLYELCKRVSTCDRLSPEIRKAAQAVMKGVDEFVIASFGMDAYPAFEPGRHGVFIMLPPDEPDMWQRYDWYTPLAGKGKHHGKWSFLRDGASQGNGLVENWFELLDQWFDEPTKEGGINSYRP